MAHLLMAHKTECRRPVLPMLWRGVLPGTHSIHLKLLRHSRQGFDPSVASSLNALAGGLDGRTTRSGNHSWCEKPTRKPFLVLSAVTGCSSGLAEWTTWHILPGRRWRSWSSIWGPSLARTPRQGPDTPENSHEPGSKGAPPAKKTACL